MNNIKNIIAAIILFVGFQVTAAEPIITGSETKSFTVDLSVWGAYDASVTITNADGAVLLYDAITDMPGKIYNLKELTNGVYNVAVSNYLQTVNSSIAISGNTVSVLGNNTNYKPIITVSDNHFDVNVLTQGSDITVDVIDSNGDTFSTLYTDMPSLNKRFVTEGLPEGDYTVIVTKGSESVMKAFRK